MSFLKPQVVFYSNKFKNPLEKKEESFNSSFTINNLIKDIKKEKQNIKSKTIVPKTNKKKQIFPMNSKYIFLNIYIFIFIYILPKISSINIIDKISSDSLIIKIIIRQKGRHQILSKGCNNLEDSSLLYPIHIQINDDFYSSRNDFPEPLPYEFDFSQDYNIIILDFAFQTINSCECLFDNCKAISEIDLSGFDTSNVVSFSAMFRGCSSLVSINFQNFKTTNAESMDAMFAGCNALKELDISMFDTQNLKIMCNMFADCTSLISLDLSKLDTSKVYNMGHLFSNCPALKTINLGDKFVTPLVQYMDYMFDRCSSLSILDLSNFQTSNVIDMSYMFNECRSLTSLIISTFTIPEVKSLRGMFQYCTSLTSLDLSGFKTQSLEDTAYMFFGCRNLTYIDISGLETSSVKVMDRMFKGCSSLSTLDLSNFYTSNAYHVADMFSECSSLTTLDLSQFDTREAIHMDGMFERCSSLTSLDLKNFYTPKAQFMMWMFNGCHKLEYLDISNFNTENVVRMEAMFNECLSLTTLDISNFKTNQVFNMHSMFGTCFVLVSLDLSKFNTENVYDMGNMFYECRKLSSLDLSNFRTPSLNITYNMFAGCNSLQYLDISNFDTSNVLDMQFMFSHCHSLKSLDLKSFDTSSVTTFYDMFSNCRSLISINLKSFNTSSVLIMQGMFGDCYDLVSLNLNNFGTSKVVNTSYMFIHCGKLETLYINNFDTSHVETMDYMFNGCTNLKYIGLTKMIIKENTLMNFFMEPNLINPVICMNDILSLDKIISLYSWNILNCSNIWGEKLDLIPNEENKKCMNGRLISKYNSECYQFCSYYFYYDETDKKYTCTEKPECPITHSKLIFGKGECVNSCDEAGENKLEFNNICLKECPEHFKALTEKGNKCNPECPKEIPFLYLDTLICTGHCTIAQRQNNLCITNYFPSKEDNFNILDVVINQTRYELFNNFDHSVVNGKAIKEPGANIIIKRSDDKGGSDNELDLTECEVLLKEHYNISQNESLYLFRIDIEQDGMAVPSFEYELLFPLNGSNLQKLNLTVCKDVKVKIDIPFNLTNDLEKYNTSSPYYNDICYITDSEEGTDITLSDRKQNYINNNMSICEDGCDFISYNTETQKAVCSCGIKTDIPFLDNVKIDKSLLMDSFSDISNIANTKMMGCYKTVFQKKNIIKNMGCFIFGVLIVLNLVCFILLLIKYYDKLKRKIKKIKASVLNNIKNRNNINQSSKKRIRTKKDKKKFRTKESSKRSIKADRKRILNKNEEPIRSIKLKKSNNNHFPPKKNNIIQIKELNINNDNKNITSLRKNTTNINKRDKNIKRGNLSLLTKKGNTKRQSEIKDKFVLKLISSEINDLSYEVALSKDKRSFLEYYFSLLKTNHLLLFVFNNEDYNSQMIKLSFLFFNIGTSIAVNSLFFNDSTMHKIYTDKGSYNFIYQLPQIIYSTIISAILNGIIKVLGLSERIIIKFKKVETNIYELDKKYKHLLTVLKVKFGLFYFNVFSLLFLFWYYVTCFCGIYRNTQLHLIKDSLVSFATSLLTPFGIYLLPGFFRTQALKRKSKFMYRFSKVLQIL